MENIREQPEKEMEIIFSDIFSIEELQRMQDLFSDAMGVASIITHPDGTPITNPSNFCRLCKTIIRKTEKGRINCLKSDAAIGRQHPSGPIVQRCLSGGLWDAGASITVGGQHIANWLIGQVRNEEVDEQQMLAYADEIGANREDFIAALNEVPVMSVAQFNSVSKILFAFANELSEKAYTNLKLKLLIDEREKATLLLQTNQENYLEIFQTVSEGICHTTLSGEILSVNKSFELISEISKEDIVGKNIMDLATKYLSAETLRINYPFLANLIKEKETQSFLLEYKNKTLEINAIINEVTGRLTGVVRDITARRLTEMELEESREKYRGLSEAAFESIFLSEKGICIEQNKTAEKMFGYTPEEALGRYGTEWIVPECRDMVMKNMLAGFEEPYEAVALRKDGTTFPCMLRGKMMYYKGRNVRVTSLSDISQRKEAEKKARQLARGIEQSPAAVIITGPNGLIEYVNPKFIEMTQYPRDRVQGKTARILNRKNNSGDILEQIWQNVNSGKEWKGEYISKRLNGEQYWESVIISPIFDLVGNIANLIIIIEDISERRAMIAELIASKEKAEESDRLKSTFLANMSHEIRTPMNAITGFSGLLIDPGLSSEDRTLYASIIQSRSDDLMRIINDILEISRIESGNATVEKEVVFIDKLIREIETVTAHKLDRLNKSHLSLVCEIPLHTEDVRFVSDPFIIKQVFTNLLDNAIKFTQTGSVRYGYNLPENGVITCFVTDTGIGISPENHTLIFEHFRQAEKQASHYGGTGLGLSICKGSLALIEGDISVESEPEKGSTFRFTLPCIPPPAGGGPDGDVNGKAQPEIRTTRISYDWTGKKLLLVEDDETNMKLLTIILKRTGAELVCAYNGVQVRQQYENLSTFNLVLADVRLPDADGLELAREIKTLRPGLPVIAQTAFAMQGDIEKSVESGCDDHISKPINKDKMLKMMDGFLRK